MIQYLFPKRILMDKNVVNPEALLEEVDLQIGLNEPNTTDILDGEILLDFGEELCGGIRILIANYSNVQIPLRVRFGESVSECLSDLPLSTNDHAVRDMVVYTTNLCDMEIGNTGFRFVKVDKLVKDPVLKIKAIVAVSKTTDKQYEGYFETSNERINEIYNTARKTVTLCIQNGYLWDGIKRDRLVWIGDLHPEFLALKTMYSNLDEVKNSMRFVKKQTPLPRWMNDIPMYSMWWIIILYDYYFQTNDFEFVLENKEYLRAVVEEILKHTDATTHFSMNFVDWPTKDHPDEAAGVHALTIIALQKAKELFSILGLNDEINLDELLSTKYQVLEKKQVKAFTAIAYNDYNEDVKEFLTNEASKSFSTFTAYYILKAMFLSGARQEALDIAKEYYGAMLDLGATTFFEDFDIEWKENAFRIDEFPIEGKKDPHGDCGKHCYKGFRHSLCHGWSSGVISFFVEYIAGIRPIEIGCKTVLVEPYLGDLEYLKCQYPTNFGPIIVFCDKNGVKVTHPQEITIIKGK